MRALFKTVLRGHLGVDAGKIERIVFPGSTAAKPPPGRLLRT